MDQFIINHLEIGMTETEVAMSMTMSAIRETLNEKVAPDCRASKTLVQSILWDHMVDFDR